MVKKSMSYKHDQRTRDRWARQKRNQRSGREPQGRQSSDNGQSGGEEFTVDDPLSF